VRDLPRLGLGISSNLGRGDVPQPYELLARDPRAFDFLEYSAPLDLAEARREAALFDTMWERRGSTPVLFHPVHLNLWGPELEPPEALRALDEHARAVGSPWVGNDIAWWHTNNRPFPGYVYVAPAMTETSLARALSHVEHVQAALSMPLAIENPTLFARRGPLHVLDFMARLHARSGAPLILDIGHLLAQQLACGHAIEAGVDGFPLERVIEIHLAGGVVTRSGERASYADDHRQPIVDDAWRLLERVLPRCTSLRALTYECDGHPPWLVLRNLARLRGMMKVPPIESRTGDAQPIGRELDDPWAIYDVAHGAVAGADPAGDAAELEYRCAVIGEELDRTTPLTRALLSVRAFVASGLLRTRTLPDAWAAFVAASDEVARKVFAVEAWANALSVQPRPSAYTTAPDVAFGYAPLDLTEVQHARTMVDKHLVGRARASGSYATSNAVREAAARAPEVPWPVVVERRRGNVELVSVGADMIELLTAASRGWSADDLARARREHPALVSVAIRRGWVVEPAG